MTRPDVSEPTERSTNMDNGILTITVDAADVTPMETVTTC